MMCCPVGWSKKHNFEPRFNHVPKQKIRDYIDGSGDPVKEITWTCLRENYIHDICTKCGKTVKSGEI